MNEKGIGLVTAFVAEMKVGKVRPGDSISVLALDRIFYELGESVNKELTRHPDPVGYVQGQLVEAFRLAEEVDDFIKSLQSVVSLNDTQFFYFMRLKKIRTQLTGFVSKLQLQLTELKDGSGNKFTKGSE